MATPITTQREIAARYFGRIAAGETVTEIANRFGVARQTVPVIARRVGPNHINNEAPCSDKRGGEARPTEDRRQEITP